MQSPMTQAGDWATELVAQAPESEILSFLNGHSSRSSVVMRAVRNLAQVAP